MRAEQEGSGVHRGRLFVELVTDVERAMSAAIHALPAVDHLATVPAPPDAATWERIADQLGAVGAPELTDAFRQWQRLDGEFHEAARRLGELHGAEALPEFPAELRKRMDEVRAARGALRSAADLLLERVADQLAAS